MSRVFQRDSQWWIDFKDASGVRRRRKIGPSKRVAREVLDGLLGSVARRQHLGIIEESPISFADFADKIWWERIKHTLAPRTQERFRGIVDLHLVPAFPGALRAITAADAENYVSRRLKTKPCDRCGGNGKTPSGRKTCSKCEGSGKMAGASASAINREMTVLKHIMRRAVSWEYRSRNPFLDSQGNLVDGLKPLKEPPGRTRFLNPDEIERLLSACETSDSPYLKPFVIVALNTGMRRNEILGLTRKAVDWENRLVTLTETKNGEGRHVYLNDTAYGALKALPARIDGRLFPLGPNQATMLFVRAAKRASLEGVRLHDTRHTFASYQAMAGVAGRGLQSLLGHKDARMTMRYSHLSEQYLRAAINRVSFGSNRTMTGEAPKIEKDGTYLAPAGTGEKAVGTK